MFPLSLVWKHWLVASWKNTLSICNVDFEKISWRLVAKPPPDTLNDRLLIVLLELCTPRIMLRTSFTCLSASLSGIGRLVVDLRFRYYCTYDIIALASLSFTNTSSNFGLSSSPCFLKNWFIALPVMSYLLMVQFLFCLILYSKSLATASSSSLEF
jgi:hypothetical protein